MSNRSGNTRFGLPAVRRHPITRMTLLGPNPSHSGDRALGRAPGPPGGLEGLPYLAGFAIVTGALVLAVRSIWPAIVVRALVHATVLRRVGLIR